MDGFTDDGAMDTAFEAFTEVTTVMEDFLNGSATNSSRGPMMEAWKMRLNSFNKIFSGIVLIVLMIAMGCTLSFKDIYRTLRHPYGVIIGAICQFIVMPLVTFGLAHAIKMPNVFAIGMLVIGCSPGGGMSNLLTYWVDGDLPLSICMTSISTILALGMMPLNLFLYARSWTSESTVIPFGNIIITLVSTIGPVIVGVLIQYKSKRVAIIIEKVGTKVGLAFIGVTVVIHTIVTKWYTFNIWKVWLAAVLLSPTGAGAGFLLASIARLRTPSRRTVAFETGCQNVPLAMSVIWLSFSRELSAKMIIFPLLFGASFMIINLTLVGLYQFLKVVCKIEFEQYKQTVYEDELLKEGWDLITAGSEKSKVVETLTAI